MSDCTPPDADSLNAIKALVGDKGWKPAAAAPGYFEDPRGRFAGRGCLVVSPATTGEAAAIVRICSGARIGIVPISGGTGVVAGQLSIDSDHALVLSLERMNRIRSVSADDGVMVAEAGCILENVHAEAQRHGLQFPLSMASKGSCCIGGNLATNAGGIQVVRHGNARDLCLGIEAVLPNGEILNELSPLRKNNTGYDLRNLLIGSEGTLGIITAATLVLKPIDPETATAFCAIPSPGAALRLFRHLRMDLGETLSALELMSGFGLDLVLSHFPALGRPFEGRHDWFLLVEAAGPQGIGARLDDALGNALERDLLSDAVLARSEAQRKTLWELRESTPEANRLSGAICSSDTSVPVSRVEEFIHRTVQSVANVHPGLRINSYGHVGDGNIHHNVFPPEGHGKAQFVSNHPGIIEDVRMAINDATHACGGSISAEHGIGRLKVKDLEIYAGKARLDAIRRIKAALDPHNIMNPGALID